MNHPRYFDTKLFYLTHFFFISLNVSQCTILTSYIERFNLRLYSVNSLLLYLQFQLSLVSKILVFHNLFY